MIIQYENIVRIFQMAFALIGPFKLVKSTSYTTATIHGLIL